MNNMEDKSGIKTTIVIGFFVIAVMITFSTKIIISSNSTYESEMDSTLVSYKYKVDSLENTINNVIKPNVDRNYREIFRIGWIRGTARANSVIKEKGEWDEDDVSKFYKADSLWSEKQVFGK